MEVASEESQRAPAAEQTPQTGGTGGTGGNEGRARLAPRWVLVLGGLVIAVGVVLRFVARSDLWLDEALSVNIARLPISDLQTALRHDGAPPLYYVLLHFWTDVFGTGNFAVRSLSGLFSVVTLPLAWFAGRRLGRPGPPGRVSDDSSRTRLVAALVVLVFVCSPYMIRFATEARMYSLVMLLVTAGYLALRRALERPSLGRLAVVAFLVALMLYTHYWTIYLLAVVGVGVIWCAFRGRTPELRHGARGVIVALVAGAITFVPWLDTFRYQSGHTGTPWGPAQMPWSAMRQALDQFGGGDNISHGEANIMVFLLFALAMLAVFGVAAGTWHIDINIGTQPAVRWEAAVAAGALLVGVTVTYLSGNGFAGRYAAMMYPLLALLVAYGFTVFSSRAAMAVVLAVFVVVGLMGGIRSARDLRTQAAEVAAVIGAEAKPGDVVVYCPDQLGPAVSRKLGDRPDLVQMTFPSGDRPEFIDWVDYLRTIRRTDPAAFAAEVIDRAGDHTVWYVVNPGYGGVKQKCEAVSAALDAARPGVTQRVVQDDQVLFELDNLYEYPAA
jgi:mannosyltransferase